MSEQITVRTTPVYRITVTPSTPTHAQAILHQLPSIGIFKAIRLKIHNLFFVEGELDLEQLRALAALVCDPVTESWSLQPLDGEGVVFFNEGGPAQSGPGSLLLEVALRPGVTDNTARELLQAARQGLGLAGLRAAATGQRYEFWGDLDESELRRIARSLLVNDTIQRYVLGEINPEFVHPASEVPGPETIPLEALQADGLLALSQDRRLALDLAEMQAVQQYFLAAGRAASDAELETIAQTWSEHCVHKTFKARIYLESAPSLPAAALPGEIDRECIDGLLKTYIQSATRQIAAPWVRSAFVDNAGVIEFDDRFDLSFKVETHNHPSAIEPFGGANTGVGGVVRDVLGVSHRPVANTDVLCFGPAGIDPAALPPGVLHPARIRSGVVAGVADYGNKLGLPTVNGAVLYHPGYTANPLVFCGCAGLGPRDVHPRTPRPGDRVILIGGRTGRDGLRGATFSSLTMDAQTGEVAGSSVQIGDPIAEKGLLEVVERARDLRLYTAITDCGAGGLSSAVGEMSAGCGAAVDLAQVPLKYAGLAPWEIWLSEAQERMVLAVPAGNLAALSELCADYWVEWSDLGEFTASGRLQVTCGDVPVVDLENEFLHHGIPLRELVARPPAPGQALSPGAAPAPSPGGAPFERGAGRGRQACETLLVRLLSHPNTASKEAIIRVYDHEVRGSTLVRPLAGVREDGPSDAAVLKPLETGGWRGFVLANGINPFIGEVDPYAMAVSCVDEAVRNALAVGADPGRLALLDNFCWGDPRRPEGLWALVQAARGCHAAALHYGTPFISGKDSLNNEYLGVDGERHAIPGTLLISCIAIHPDVRRAVTLDLKTPGDGLYLAGDWVPALAGSHAGPLAGAGFFGSGPDALAAAGRAPGLPERAARIYPALHAAIQAGLVSAAHDLSEGGLALAAAEMCLAGRLGLALDLSALHPDPRLALFAETNGCLLLEVPAESAAAFEAGLRLEDGRPAFLRLGEVSRLPALQVWHAGEMWLDLPVVRLVAAFQGNGEAEG